MARGLFIVATVICVLSITEINAHGFYEQYPYPQYPNFQRPYRNPYPNNQFLSGASVETEWVCKNPKTGDMMIIAADNTPVSRMNGPSQNIYRYPQSQTPMYFQPVSENPSVYPQNPSLPNQPATYPQNVPNPPTTEIPKGPVWDTDNGSNQPNDIFFQATTTTTQKSSIWPINDNKNLPGFTEVVPILNTTPKTTPKTTPVPTSKPTPKPTRQTEDLHDDDDDEPIKIVIGKK